MRLILHASPGETRAVLLNESDRPARLFLERWAGAERLARCGSVHSARLRRFADDIQGAFLELESGEEAFLRLKARGALTEGAALTVRVESERRREKLARVSLTEDEDQSSDALTRWCRQVSPGGHLTPEADRDLVEQAFEQALAEQITLPSGGHIHIERTRALTAVDIDTAGRRQKGSAGAKALSINREAVVELARQVGLRGLGGTIVLDCIGPLNKSANDTLKAAAIDAFIANKIEGVTVLPPSSLGLMTIALPWRFCPVQDRLMDNPGETELLRLLRDAQREAEANSSIFLEIQLCKSARAAYLAKRSESDHALQTLFAGRVSIHDGEAIENKVLKR